jgi:hypothetical protein
MTSNAAVRTVYRLSGVAPTPDAMLDALDLQLLDRLGAYPHSPEALGVPTVYLSCGMERTEAPWCASMALVPVMSGRRCGAAGGSIAGERRKTRRDFRRTHCPGGCPHGSFRTRAAPVSLWGCL